jgi:predicted phage terminase large subunit-like protein
MTILNLSQAEFETVLRHDFKVFLERAFYELNPQVEFIDGRYIDLMASWLEKCRMGETKRLILNLPPRTLKSHAASVAFVAWLLGHDPSLRIICASYGQDLSEKHARDCRTLMLSAFYRKLFPRARLSPEKMAVNDFMTTAAGYRMSTSVGGTLTGRGADIIILDDTMKPDDALSETRRKNANEWFFNTLLSRLNNKANGVIILVMQRLHQADLVGEVLEREPWDVLALPAIAVQDEKYEFHTPFGIGFYSRKAGQALHPERDSVETYMKIREAVGEYNFQSQYQQSPGTLEGGMIKREWLRYYDPMLLPPDSGSLPPDLHYKFQSWDTASKSGNLNDYSVCTTWGVRFEKIYLIDVFRARLNYPDLKKAAFRLRAQYSPFKIVIEDKGSGISLIQDLKAEYVFEIESYAPNPGMDKVTRFSGQSLKFEKGQVYLPKEADWLEEYVRELTGFPGSKYDDQVDSTSQALEVMSTFLYSENYQTFQWPAWGHERSGSGGGLSLFNL